MCGILCGKNYLINEEEIKNGLKKINHRGPDESSYIKVDDVFIGHTRLSIVDINGGQQPFFNSNNSIVAVVNGEFYNYKKIRIHLAKMGHIFKTKSDSEILVHLYEELGVDCLSYLHGEFAFVLYDRNRKQWFCARDRNGIKPLQFYFKNDMFLIASEAKALLEFKKVDSGFDKESFWFSQHVQYLPLDKTLFKNIEMIKPAHFLIFNEGDRPKQIEYWKLKDIQEVDIGFNEAKEKVVHLLNKAVKKRIPEEVKWATHLSGGVDSSVITALSKKHGNDVTAFTVEFTDDENYNEGIIARETAKMLDVNLIEIPVNFADLISNIKNAVYYSEGLSINGHMGAKFILNKEIKKAGFKVALSGEGADEIFMGYSHLKQDYFSKSSLNNFEKQYLTGFQIPDDNMLDLSVIKNSCGFVPTWIQAKSSMAFKFKDLWTKTFQYKKNPYESIIGDLSGFDSKLKNSSNAWMKYCLSGYILKVLDDGQAMANSIEGRLPFLDTELMEFIYSLPDDLYFYNKNGVIQEKGLLREAFKDMLPQSVINKTKQSFMSPPINRFINNKEFKILLEDYILENNKFKDLDVFDINKIKKLLTSNDINTNGGLEPIIMTLLCTGIFVKELL